jgi:integrase/recombinase XerD
MARPLGNVYASHETTIEDLREEFLARARAKNLAARTIEWYDRHSLGFERWCTSHGVELARDLRGSHLDDFLVSMHETGVSPHTVRGAARTIKALSRFGFRKEYIPTEITKDFTMPKVPQVIIETFNDEQLRALLGAPDQRKWVGLRDRAMLTLMLDTLARVSEVTGLNVENVDLEDRSIRVMGKGRKERDIPFGQVAAQAMHRYARSVEDQRSDDPFFISYRGRRMKREDVASSMRGYGLKARIEGVRCSPHTLRHTGAKRFILNGGDVFTLQKLLGHTTLVMVRRYVELASVDVRRQHERFSPADSLLRRPTPEGRIRE